jgi:hypothetical protein
MHDSSDHKERCFYCQHSKHGHGQQDCSKCGSKGRVNCGTCDGHGQIRCYIQLSITWKTNTAEHIVERLDLPNDLIRDVSGQVAYEEEAPRVKSIDAFSDNLGIKEASTSLVFNHLNSFSDHKVIRQRHQVLPCCCGSINLYYDLHHSRFELYPSHVSPTNGRAIFMCSLCTDLRTRFTSLSTRKSAVGVVKSCSGLLYTTRRNMYQIQQEQEIPLQ